MIKYRPSKSFIRIIVPSCVLLVALGFGLLSELEELKVRAIPGEIVFHNLKPIQAKSATVPISNGFTFLRPREWFEDRIENLMTWEHNPWKRSPREFGYHYMILAGSKDPLDQAKCREIRRLAEWWYQRMLLRFPEMAVKLRSVPDEQNGFLKWLDLCDRFVKASGLKSPTIEFPNDLDAYLRGEGSWNQDSAKAWLAGQKPLLDELRAIGLMPEQSINGIPVERYGFIHARLAKNCGQALIIEARLAAEMGDVSAALQATRAAKGLSDHFGRVETPSLLAATVEILLKLDLEHRVLHEILPALPPNQVNPQEWEAILNPTVKTPAEFGELMKGEWSVAVRQWVLPILLDTDDPKAPPDSAELLDAFTMNSLEYIRVHEGARLEDLPALKMYPTADTTHLSRTSQNAMVYLTTGMTAWRRGWERSQSMTAMTQAAFAIMRNQPSPKDPVYGQEYRWDPTSRQLSMPAGKEIDALDIKPITVPKLGTQN